MVKCLRWMAGAACLIGCTHISTKTAESTRLAQTVQKQNEWIQNLKDENRILRQRLEEWEHPAIVSPESPLQTVEAPTEKGEHYLYAKVIESYRTHKTAELMRAVELLAKGYPTSVHLDNAYYLAGLSETARDHLLEAKKWYARILREQPQGNKVVSALFANAMVDRRMHQNQQARAELELVQKLYPGSGESQRAALELKLLNGSHKDEVN